MSNDLVILSKSELMALVINKDYQKDQLYIFTKEQLTELLNKAQVVNGEAVGVVAFDGIGEQQTTAIKWLTDYRPKQNDKLYISPQPAIPEGFMLVPIEPDEEMIFAGAEVIALDEVKTFLKNIVTKVYKAMLSVPKKEGV